MFVLVMVCRFCLFKHLKLLMFIFQGIKAILWYA